MSRHSASGRGSGRRSGRDAGRDPAPPAWAQQPPSWPEPQWAEPPPAEPEWAAGRAEPGWDGPAEPRWGEQGDAEHGYAGPGHAEPGWAEEGYAEPGYAEPGWDGPVRPRWDEPGWDGSRGESGDHPAAVRVEAGRGGRARPGDPREVAPGTRSQHLTAAGIALVATGVLAASAQLHRSGLAAALAAIQLLLVVAWVVGTGLPGRIGGLLIGAGAAAAADATMLVKQPATLSALLGVLALCLPALLAHQLSRGVVRVRVTESLSGVTVLCVSVAALAAHLALARAVDGPRLVSAAVVAAGAALIACHLVDTVLPVPRVSAEVPHGLLGVAVAVGAGGLAGTAHALHDATLSLAGGAALGAGVGAVASLVAVGVGYLAQTVEPLQVPLAGLALPYLRVALPLALSAPVGYLLALYVTG